MSGDRQSLSMPSFDEMDDFAPRETAGQGAGTPVTQSPVAAPEPDPAPLRAPVAAVPQPRPVPSAAETRRAVDAVSQFPSREASSDGQLNLKGPRHVLDRFRKLCKDDRRAYYDMLEILMDRFEGKA